MRISIKYKLFLTMFLTTSIVMVSMYFFMRWSFHRGYLDYANAQAFQNMVTLAEALKDRYESWNSWQPLQGNYALWHQLLSVNKPSQGRDTHPPMDHHRPPPVGNRKDPLQVGPRTILLDAEKNWIVGGNKWEAIDNQKMKVKPIEVGGETVGLLAIMPMEELHDAGDIRYVERQTRIFGGIALAMILMSMVLAIPLIHHLLVPVKAMIRGAEKLTSGEYGLRIPVSTGDELGRLSEHFNLLAATLERNEASRRNYMADVSHDLRTPLAILLGEIEAMQDGVRDVATTLPVLHSEVKHLNRLVDDLFELSLSDIGALDYRKQRIDPVIALEQVIERYAPRMADRDISMVSDLPDEGTLAVNADPSRLQQLFTNLLENSMRYTDSGGQVQVTMSRVDRGLKVEIQDSVPGVSEEQLPKLFVRHFRVETSRNRTRGGSGLGLAICRNIVDAHQGRIEARPSPLGGLMIEIVLPLL
jgi:two-component system sensor histidine kinase BaeS